MKAFAALVAGSVFGFGLALAGMTEPENILNFLRITSPAWSPSMIVVLASAVVVTTAGYLLVNKRKIPLFKGMFDLPTATLLDVRLLSGAGVFGIGWGTAGFCPGPAIVGVFTMDPRAWLFFVAYLIGNFLYYLMFENQPKLLVEG